MRRIIGITFGLATQALFLFTVWYLFSFLKGNYSQRNYGSLWIDAALALQFAVPHSLLLLPTTRRRLARWIPSAFYGCFFCVATCLGLLLTFAFWRGSPVELWRFHGWIRIGIESAFIGSWVALFYSLSLTGLGYQTGLTPWWQWVRGRSGPRSPFEPHGVYHWFRHPIYLSFLGLLWFTPVMTLDRAVLTGLLTVYIFIGSYLKDERLAFYNGESYRRYQSLVVGYPLVFFGPLGKRPLFTSQSDSRDTRHSPVPRREQPERRAA